jgi:hypothetical protein
MIMHIPAIVRVLKLMQGLISQGSDPGQGSGGFNRAPPWGGAACKGCQLQ